MPSTVDLDIAFAIDMTGSMLPYISAAVDTTKSLICGNTSILTKVTKKFPEIDFNLQTAFPVHRYIDNAKINSNNKVTRKNTTL